MGCYVPSTGILHVCLLMDFLHIIPEPIWSRGIPLCHSALNRDSGLASLARMTGISFLLSNHSSPIYRCLTMMVMRRHEGVFGRGVVSLEIRN